MIKLFALTLQNQNFRINILRENYIMKRGYIGPLTRVIHLNLFLDMVPRSSANFTRALRGKPRRPYTQGHAKLPETKWRQMWKKVL